MYIDLYDVVVREQWRFRLLCSSCHGVLGRIERYTSGSVNRMLGVVKEMDVMRGTHPTEHQALLSDTKG